VDGSGRRGRPPRTREGARASDDTVNRDAVPLVDLVLQHDRHATEIEAALREVMASAAFIGGPAVDRFEEAFAQYCGTSDAIGVASGTDALYLALRAGGIGPGDEVITVSHTFVATAAAIELTGARPVLVDVDPQSYCMSPAAAEAAVTSRTACILPVHLYGHPADMGPLLDLAERKGLLLIEDAAQAHGARWRDRRVGSLGALGCFSCYPSKNLGAMGDAGIVTTSDPVMAARIRKLRDHGRREKYTHDEIGVNARIDTIQAAALEVKLRYLDADNEVRRAKAAWYEHALADVVDRIPSVASDVSPVWHLYVVEIADRDAVLAALHAAGIGAGVHYPVPVHLQPAFAHLGVTRGSLPVSERVVDVILSLPLYPEMTEAQQERVVGSLAAARREIRRAG